MLAVDDVDPLLRNQLPQTLADDPIGAFVLEVIAEARYRWRKYLVLDHPEAVVRGLPLGHRALPPRPSPPAPGARAHVSRAPARTYSTRCRRILGGNESVTSSRFIQRL